MFKSLAVWMVFLALFGLAGKQDYNYRVEQHVALRLSYLSCMARKRKLRVEYRAADKKCRKWAESDLDACWKDPVELINHNWKIK